MAPCIIHPIPTIESELDTSPITCRMHFDQTARSITLRVSTQVRLPTNNHHLFALPLKKTPSETRGRIRPTRGHVP